MVGTMNNAKQLEEQDNEMLRKSEVALEYARQKESEARRALIEATKTVKTLKQKYERQFAECEERACQRRRKGLIEVNAGY